MLRQLLLTTAAAATVTAASLGAQCNGPDGLNGPCWQPTVATVPVLPSAGIPGGAFCWKACVPQPEDCIRLSIGMPNRFACGMYDATLQVDDCTGSPLMRGVMMLDYTRTWIETPTPNDKFQVYRFAAKVDLSKSIPGFVSCITPSCFSAHQTAFYYGYVDYAFDCVTGGVQNSIVLYHACDEFVHDPLSSVTPGNFHPDASFALIGPHTAASPFVPGFNSPTNGSLVAEAVRPTATTAGLCITEDPISQGNVQFIGDGCACPFQLNPKMLTARRWAGAGSCTNAAFGPSTFQSVNTTPAFPWFHGMNQSLGHWTDPAIYPGEEIVSVEEIAMVYRDSCVMQSFGEVYYGATTEKGWPVDSTIAGLPITDKFTDLAANASFVLPGGPAGPFVGSVLPTRNLIYTNVP